MVGTGLTKIQTSNDKHQINDDIEIDGLLPRLSQRRPASFAEDTIVYMLTQVSRHKIESAYTFNSL